MARAKTAVAVDSALLDRWPSQKPCGFRGRQQPLAGLRLCFESSLCRLAESFGKAAQREQTIIGVFAVDNIVARVAAEATLVVHRLSR